MLENNYDYRKKQHKESKMRLIYVFIWAFLVTFAIICSVIESQAQSRWIATASLASHGWLDGEIDGFVHNQFSGLRTHYTWVNHESYHTAKMIKKGSLMLFTGIQIARIFRGRASVLEVCKESVGDIALYRNIFEHRYKLTRTGGFPNYDERWNSKAIVWWDLKLNEHYINASGWKGMLLDGAFFAVSYLCLK